MTASSARESALVLRLLRRLRRDHPGSWWLKIHGSVYGRAGVPDILGCVDGRFVAVEVKRPGNKPTRIQAMEHARIRRAGGIVLVVDELGTP